MPKVYEYLGLRKTQGDIGVEIEVEGINLPDSTLSWSRERDGSLRGIETGEYVLDRPLSREELSKAFRELAQAFDSHETHFDRSNRAGIHVHINVQELTLIQLFNYITLFLLFEESLLELCDKYRKGNHFCLRSKDAGYFPQKLLEAAETENVKVLNTEDIRYSAMNITSMFKYGSVEFRFIESTNDLDKVEDWCDLFYTLRESATTFRDPKEIINYLSMGGYRQFVNEVLKKHADKITSQPEWESSIRRGIRIAQDIAFSRSWGLKNLDIFSKNHNLL